MLPFFAKLPPCLVGIEACGTSHHWAHELIKLGHEVRLMPPAYVKPYVKRGKTDAADAEAVCEAVTRPTMRFVPVKSPEQQAALSMHRTRDLLVKQRTQLINMIRGLLAEFGVDIPTGLERALLMARQIIDGKAPEVPIEGTADRLALHPTAGICDGVLVGRLGDRHTLEPHIQPGMVHHREHVFETAVRLAHQVGNRPFLVAV
jgi:transposase